MRRTSRTAAATAASFIERLGGIDDFAIGLYAGDEDGDGLSGVARLPV